MQVSEEEFAEWRGHPVTEEIFKLLTGWADQQKALWAAQAWSEGAVDPLLLKEAQVREDCYRVMPECSYEDWQAVEDKLNDSKS